MDSEKNHFSFEDMVLAVGNLDENERVQVQQSIQEMFDKLPPEQLPLGRNIEHLDMRYFEMLKTNSDAKEIEIGSLLNSVSKLDTGKLILLDALITFLDHKLDAKAALPHVLGKLTYETKLPSGDTSFVFPFLVLPKKTKPEE